MSGAELVVEYRSEDGGAPDAAPHRQIRRSIPLCTVPALQLGRVEVLDAPPCSANPQFLLALDIHNRSVYAATVTYGTAASTWLGPANDVMQLMMDSTTAIDPGTRRTLMVAVDCFALDETNCSAAQLYDAYANRCIQYASGLK